MSQGTKARTCGNREATRRFPETHLVIRPPRHKADASLWDTP